MKKAAGTYFPMGLGYIAAYAKKHGYDVTFIDPDVQEITYGDIAEFVSETRPALVGISFMTPQLGTAKEIVDSIRKKVPDAPIVLGGAHPSVMPSESLQQIRNADYVVFGEGEQTTLELLNFLTKKEGVLPEIAGLAWRRGDDIVCNDPRSLIEDLDSLPYPDRELIDQSLYQHQSFLNYYTRIQTIYTSRGCPGRCVFCASGHKLRSKVRTRSIESIMGEIDHLRSCYDIEYLLIKDDTFTLNKRRIREFCSALKRNHPDLRWHCMCRVDTVDYEILSVMKDSGLSDVFFGIESGNDDILKAIAKHVTTEKVREAVGAAHRLGIRTYGAFILGLPGDNPETINETINFACSLPLTMAGFSILIPYPGTKVFEDHYSSEGDVDFSSFIASTGVHYVEGYTGLQGMEVGELPHYITVAQKKFYMRPRQLFRMMRHMTPSMVVGYAKGFVSLVMKQRYLQRKERMK